MAAMYDTRVSVRLPARLVLDLCAAAGGVGRGALSRAIRHAAEAFVASRGGRLCAFPGCALSVTAQGRGRFCGAYHEARYFDGLDEARDALDEVRENTDV
jgi:hypothetical protein